MRRPLSPLLPLATFAALMGLSTAVTAGGTRTHRVQDFDDFDEGTTQGTAVESSGTLTRGTTVRRQEIDDVNSAFSCLAGARGNYIGTADSASVRRVTLGKKGPSSEVLATLDGVVVTAMHELPGGDLVVATLPGNVLTRVTRTGKTSVFATLDGVERIWALTRVGERILVGTGPRGEVWSVALDGKDARVVLDAEAKDVLSLLAVDGALLAGTSPSAKVFQVTDEKEGLLVYDFKGDEVRALAASGRGIVAAVNDFEDRKIGTVKNLQTQLARTNLTGAPPARKSTSEAEPDASAALYFVDLAGADGRRDVARALEATWETWLDVEEQYFTDLTSVSRDEMLVSSSRAGRIYRVRGRRDHATLADLDERLATSVCVLQGKSRSSKRPRVFATAGQGAAVYTLSDLPAAESQYTSEVFDADQPARYGALIMQASGNLTASIRVGPTETPDARWTKWTTVALTATPQGRRGDLAAIPQRRYAQVRLTLESDAAEVRAFTLYYAPENLAPRVRNVAFEAPDFDTDDDEEPEASATLAWDADDDDDDALIYTVRIRPDGTDEQAWIDLTPTDELLTKEKLEFDIASVPDGVYEASVMASDEPENGSASARTDEARSAPFIVDRGRPSIEDLVIDGTTVRGRARDDFSNIHDVAYRIDDGPFHLASPADGLFDNTSEAFEIQLPPLPGNLHRLVVRARDGFGNFVTTAVTLRP